jgi:hypothetical protein
MAHIVAPNPARPELPLFFNLDGAVGEAPAENRKEDVLLVQFAFQELARKPLPTSRPEVVAAARAVSATGAVDQETIAAIRTIQAANRAENPYVIVDGRVSPAQPHPYLYEAAFWTITHLNRAIQWRNREVWPRLDQIQGCPPELAEMVTRTLVGV